MQDKVYKSRKVVTHFNNYKDRTKNLTTYKLTSVFLLYAEELHVLHDAEQYGESLHHRQTA